MSDPSLEDPSQVSIQDVIRAYLYVNPTPTDQELHAFAELIGTPYEEFETKVFELLAEEVDDSDPEDIEDAVTDETDILLLTLFSWLKSPTEELVHKLAPVLNITPEELEESLYRLLSTLSDEGDEED